MVALDIKDFFPSIKRGAIETALLGCSSELKGNKDLREAVLWAVTRHDALPQGAPTSPTLSNLVFRRLDYRLAALARAYKASYTRYADDLYFSSDENR